MTDDTAHIGDTVRVWPLLLQKVWERLRVGGSFFAGAPNGESCKNTDGCNLRNPELRNLGIRNHGTMELRNSELQNYGTAS